MLVLYFICLSSALGVFTHSFSSCGLVDSHLLIWNLQKQCGIEGLLKTFNEIQV